ncbi:WYL domain-containing protein [Mangrovactinospora gilvigrisea]|uniref:WYL domain-containing protein n=1 Tax=Mangrovactinospora gilvigrisea TaxID=1428644 RepID=A0A1J7BIB3_9ACTN|nr:WYL domain-containing protein [Mangrovactinospora gilvigrisea]OIV38403.1 WYL domain-containing protein [Mangrovactinospora gilvigrisea]
MAIPKAERLMNLALCLMNARRPLSKRELRASIEAYASLDGGPGGADEAAFNRMFERDKEDLRELGLVIETGESPLDGETGYLAKRASNRLPELALAAEEAAALALAARVWQQARLAGAASGALQKLRAAGAFGNNGGAAEGSPAREEEGRATVLEPRIPAHEPSFDKLMLAARERRPVTFAYRRSGAPEPGTRTVEPWALECWHGHWYLAGFDRDREDARVFKLSRIVGQVRTRSGGFTAEVPAHVDVREHVARFAGEGATATARVRLRRGVGWPLRTKALAEKSAEGEWDEVELPYGHGLAADLAEFGADVLVLGPEELRAEVLAHLRAAAGVKGAETA